MKLNTLAGNDFTAHKAIMFATIYIIFLSKLARKWNKTKNGIDEIVNNVSKGKGKIYWYLIIRIEYFNF